MRRIIALMTAVLLLGTGMVSGCGSTESNLGETLQTNPVAVKYSAEISEWFTGGYPKGVFYDAGVLTTLKSDYDEAMQKSTYFLYSIDLESEEQKNEELKLSENGNIYVGGFGQKKDKSYVVLFTETAGDGEDASTSNKGCKLVNVDATGQVLSETDLTELMSDNLQYVQDMVIDSEDNVFISLNGENANSMVLILDVTGDKKAEKKCDVRLNPFIVTAKGEIYASYWREGNNEISRIDANGNLSNAVTLPESDGRVFGGDNENVFYSDGNSLCRFDMGSKAAVEVLNWMDNDINANYVDYVVKMDENCFAVLMGDYSTDVCSVSVAVLTQKNGQDVVEPTEIVYGCMFMDYNMRNEILKFNRENEQYKIVIKEYGGDDYQASLTNMRNDYITGNVPDIIDLASGVSMKSLASKGVLANMNELIEQDPEIHREDYFENVMDAFEMDGKLYFMPTAFMIYTLVARESEVGSAPGWTLEEMMEYADRQSTDTLIFSASSRESVLYNCALYNMNRFVNWETGESSFDSDEFINILNFANRFKKETPSAYNEVMDHLPELLDNHEVLCTNALLTSPNDYQIYRKLYQDDMVLIGYPNSEGGNGSYFMTNMLKLAISEKSENKDVAWSFIRTLIMDDFQNSDENWGFPIKKSAFEAEMVKYTTDEYAGRVSKWGDTEMLSQPCTKEEVNAVLALVNETTTADTLDTDIDTIIREETEAYFEGQKSAEEVVKIIQSRAQVYLNENQ